MTPPEGEAPFLVKVLDAETVIAEQTFDSHHAACVVAVEALRRAISPP